MLKVEACFLVFAFFGLSFVFGNQHSMLRHKAIPFLLVHNNDSEAFSHWFWGELLSGFI